MKDRVALVTGSGRGIGAATARLLAERGCRVVVSSRTQAQIDAVVADIANAFGTNVVMGVRADVADPASVVALFDTVERQWGPVEILVNNAALAPAREFLTMTLDDFDSVMDVNVRGTFLCSQQMMMRLKNAGKPGAIVNLSSLGGIRGTEKFKGLAAYTASKSAVVGLTEAMAVEGRELKIRVNCVAPGAVDTEMLRAAAPHLKTDTKPADAARVIAYLCDSAESGSVTGSTIEIFSNL